MEIEGLLLKHSIKDEIILVLAPKILNVHASMVYLSRCKNSLRLFILYLEYPLSMLLVATKLMIAEPLSDDELKWSLINYSFLE